MPGKKKKSPPIEGVTKPLKTATFVLRMSPEEKAEVEQKVRVAAAQASGRLASPRRFGWGAPPSSMR